MMKLKIAAVVLILAGAVAGGTGLATASDNAQSAKIPAGYTGPNDPRLLACEHAKLVCDPQASSWRVIEGQPFSHPEANGATYISLGDAESRARSMVEPNAPASGSAASGTAAPGTPVPGTAAPGSAAASAAGPTSSPGPTLSAAPSPAPAPASGVLMTGAQAMALFRIQRSANIDETRMVWVITLKIDLKPDSLVPVPTRHYYSAIIDAASGVLTDDCIGCQWIDPNGQPIPTTAGG